MSDESKIKVIFGDKEDEAQTPEAPESPVEPAPEEAAQTSEEDIPEAEVPEEELPEAAAEKASGNGVSEEEEADDGPGFQVKDRRFWNLSDEELEEDEGAQPEVPSFVADLQRKVEEKDKQLREYIAAYKKEVGEGLERTKERLTREADQKLERTRGKMVLPMLDVLDALERSVVAAEQADNFEALLDGVKMVQKLMVQRLEEMGLSRVPSLGSPFDPNMHEALAMAAVTDPEQDKMVVMEFKPGFMLGERVVRPAQVQVGKLT
jgi:molecular chaperone GrpE